MTKIEIHKLIDENTMLNECQSQLITKNKLTEIIELALKQGQTLPIHDVSVSDSNVKCQDWKCDGIVSGKYLNTEYCDYHYELIN